MCIHSETPSKHREPLMQASVLLEKEMSALLLHRARRAPLVKEDTGRVNTTDI